MSCGAEELRTALWAAGECKPKIDLVVCLSTPFVCLQTRGADGKVVDLPVYCSPRGRKNIGKIEPRLFPGSKGTDQPWGVAFDGNNRVVVGGASQAINGKWRFAVARYVIK